LAKENSELKDKLKKADADILSKENELKLLNDRYAQLQGENKKLSSDIVNLDVVVKREREGSSSAEKLKAALAEAEKRLTALNQELAPLKAKIAELTREKEALLKEREKSIAEMKSTYDRLVSEMKAEIKKGEITISRLRDKLTFTIVERVLFDSGSVKLRKDGEAVLDRTLNIIQSAKDKEIRIAGYTDDVPIGPSLKNRFSDNWELSVSRAANVAAYLQKKGIDPKRMSAMGYSEFRPIESNESSEGRAKNRRIEIIMTAGDLTAVPDEETSPSPDGKE